MGVTGYNQTIIDEFRANGGVVGGPFQGAKLLLLHTVGAKSGESRINPLAYFEDGDDLLIVASYAGAPTNPPWYYNLLANTTVKLEVGNSAFSATASIVPEPQRTELYDRIANKADAFAQYRDKTTRVIPVVRLEKTG
jgi:deazaflavin-dependent oxidoreductase (nitroreductase family)